MSQQSPLIAQSNLACRDIYCLNPNELPTPKTVLSDFELKKIQRDYGEVLQVTKFFMLKFLDYLKGIPILVALSDDRGYLIETFGNTTIEALINKIGYRAGVLFAESDVGTNSISLALEKMQPMQVIGEDHYHQVLKQSACLSVPFQFNHPKDLKGTVSIMTTLDYADQLNIGILSSAVDSIERELLLRQKNRQLNILKNIVVDSTRNGIIVTDNQGYIVEFNSFSEVFLGCTKEELLGKKVTTIKQFGQYVQNVLNSGMEYEDIHLKIEDEQRSETKWCLLDARPMYDEYGSMNGAFAQFRDITEHRQLEQKMLIAEKLSDAGKLSASLVHEIRNPLTPILGFLKLMGKNFETSSEEERYLRLIHEEIERINHLVNQFGAMAKPMIPNKEHCIINHIISDTVLLVESLAQDHQINIRFECEEEIMLPVDKNQMKQVLQNLIRNAIEATPEAGDICIHLTKTDEHAVVKVIDQGIGISKEISNQLAVPFKSTKENGLGIGLSICYKIIESHQGQIEADRNADKGTTFTIKLPLK